MKKEFNHEKIKEAIRTILTELGDDPDREGLKDTPDRVARMYDEIFEGMRYTNDEIAEMFNKCFEVDSNDLVTLKILKFSVTVNITLHLCTICIATSDIFRTARLSVFQRLPAYAIWFQKDFSFKNVSARILPKLFKRFAILRT